jgi:hypothetical protein
LSSPEKAETNIVKLPEKISRPSQFLAVINPQADVMMPNSQFKKPRGSFNYNNIQRPQMTVDRMDSIRSMKNNMLMDPFMRTNQALLKRLDSIGSVFNKSSNNFIYYTGFPSYISQASNRLKNRETPMFQNEGVSRVEGSEREDKVSCTFSNWDKRNSATFAVRTPVRGSVLYKNSPRMKDSFIKSGVSAVSMDEICDFEDYIPFKPSYNLEQIDEEKAVGLDFEEEK